MGLEAQPRREDALAHDLVLDLPLPRAISSLSTNWGSPTHQSKVHGADDDWTLAATCRTYTDRLAASGNDATMTEYKGALHAFDSQRNPARFTDSDNQTSRNCMRSEEDGKLVNAATGRPFGYSDASVAFGPSSQYNGAAATAAQAAVKAFLEEVFWRN
jgi:dienelactone hydrolase